MFTKFFAPFCPLVFLFWVFGKTISLNLFDFTFEDFSKSEILSVLLILNIFALIVSMLESNYSKTVKDNPIPTWIIYLFGSFNILNFGYVRFFESEPYWPSVGLFCLALLLGSIFYMFSGFLKDTRLYSRTREASKTIMLPRIPRPLKYTLVLPIILMIVIVTIILIVTNLFNVTIKIVLLGILGPIIASISHLFIKENSDRIEGMQALFDTYDAQINMLEGKPPLSFEGMQSLKKVGVNASMVLNSTISSKVMMMANIDGETRLLSLQQAFDRSGQPKHTDMQIQVPSGITLNLMEMVELSLIPGSENFISSMIENALKNGGDPDEAYAQGWTPFLFAAANSNITIAKLMIEYGADVNKPTLLGRRAVHYVASHGSLEMLKLLVDHGAEIEPVLEGNQIESYPLHVASENGREDIVEFLLEHGGIPSLKDKFGNDAIYYAKKNKHNSIVAKLRSAMKNQKASD